MAKLTGVSRVSKYCGESELIIVSTDPVKRGVRVKARTGGREVYLLDGTGGRTADKSTRADGTAEFRIRCSNVKCPGNTHVTFSSPTHTAHRTHFDCRKRATRSRHAFSSNVSSLVYTARHLATAQGALEVLTQQAIGESDVPFDEDDTAIDSEEEELTDEDDEGA